MTQIRKIFVAFTVLLSLSFAACGDGGPSTPTAPPPQAPAGLRIHGRVQDAESGAGIDGAIVIVRDTWTGFSEVGRSVTAADGRYEITGITVGPAPDGGAAIQLKAFADGYLSDGHDHIWPATLTPTGELNFSPNLKPDPDPPCTVVGSVRDQAGRGVAGASVQASNGSPNSWMQRRTMTGSDGRYAIPELTGSYYLDVIAEGYNEPPTQEVLCRDAGQDSLVEIDFTLEPGSPTADPDFIRWFWNQIVFNTRDCPPSRCGAPLEQRSSYLLSTSSPDFHIRTHNDGGERVVSEERVQQIRAEIPRIVTTITGQPFGGRISDGAGRATGQITIEFIPQEELRAGMCGRATIGSAQGLVEINSQALSQDEARSDSDGCPLLPVLRHEMGHAMGFFHVVYGGDLMSWHPRFVTDFSAREVHHMQLAYRLGPLQSSPYGPLLKPLWSLPSGSRSDRCARAGLPDDGAGAPALTAEAVLACQQQLSPVYPLEPTTDGLYYGQQACFLGFPFGWDGGGAYINHGLPLPFVKAGIISAFATDEPVKRIYLDAHVNKGFSGGPVVFLPDDQKVLRVAGVVVGYPKRFQPVVDNHGNTVALAQENPGLVLAISIHHVVALIDANQIGFALPS